MAPPAMPRGRPGSANQVDQYARGVAVGEPVESGRQGDVGHHLKMQPHGRIAAVGATGHKPKVAYEA